MANDLTGNPWIIDTAGANILSTDQIHIKSIRWVNATTVGHHATIQNQLGKVIWDSYASGAGYIESEMIEQWFSGLIVPTLGSGILYILLGKGRE